jgi:hypothetical protein
MLFGDDVVDLKPKRNSGVLAALVRSLANDLSQFPVHCDVRFSVLSS